MPRRVEQAAMPLERTFEPCARARVRATWLGALLLAVTLVASGCAYTKNNRMRRKGVEAQARVTTVETTGISVEDDPVVEIGLRIEDEHGRGFDAVARQAVPLAQLSALRPGTEVTVRHDPEKPGKAVVVGRGRAPDEAAATRQLHEAQAVQARLNQPGVARRAQGVVMSLEELGIVVNQVGHVVELRVMVIPEPGPEGPSAWPEESDGVDNSPLRGEPGDAQGFRDPRPSYEVESTDVDPRLDAETPLWAEPSQGVPGPTEPRAASTAPFEASFVAVILTGRLDRYGPGKKVALVYDPADPTHVHIDRSRTPGCVSTDDGRVECEDADEGDSALSDALTSSSGLSPADAEREERKALGVRRAGFGLLAVGTAGVIAGASVQAVSASTRRERDSLDRDDPNTTARYEKLDTQATTQRRAALATLATGATLMVTGLVVLTFGKLRLQRARAAQGKIGLEMSPGGVGLRF